MKKLAIIGGGASGLCAAVRAAQSGGFGQVTVLERGSRVGRKLLATGNGRCNLTNRFFGEQNYRGGNPAFTRPAFRRFGLVETLEFFESLGLLFHEEENGKLYPRSLQAASVLDALRLEAEALLAGIVLDTKHFTLRTGGRTFEAAAFLRRAGADTTDVQRLFQSDLSEMVSRYDIIRRAELYREDIAVAAIDQEGVDRVTAAQAADELLSLKGVKASFVVFRSGENVQMSARSLGEINVQVILEALGGGGNSTTAGGRVENTDVETVKTRLLEAIDAYFEK